jgi:hypothetical protein
VTIMIRPSGGVGCESSRFDLGQMATNIFRKIRNKRLDSPVTKPPDGQITKFVGWVEPRETHHLHKMQLMGIAEFIIGRASARPMTGSAKQSILPQRKNGLLRCARNDD